MNKKASSALRIVLGGYLAWLGIRILLEVNETKPSNTVFMGIMAVIFIIIGGGYAAFSVRQVLKIRKEEMGFNETAEENKIEEENTPEHSYVSRGTSDIKPVELKKEIQEEGSQEKETDDKDNTCDNVPDEKTEGDDNSTDQDTPGVEKDNCDEKHSQLEIEIQSDRSEEQDEIKSRQTELAIEIVEDESADEETDEEEIERDYEEK